MLWFVLRIVDFFFHLLLPPQKRFANCSFPNLLSKLSLIWISYLFHSPSSTTLVRAQQARSITLADCKWVLSTSTSGPATPASPSSCLFLAIVTQQHTIHTLTIPPPHPTTVTLSSPLSPHSTIGLNWDCQLLFP